jgi:transposase
MCIRYNMAMNTSPSSNVHRARVKRPERAQIEWRPLALDQLLPQDHRARLVWAYVDSLDLSPLYEKIQAVEGKAGRDAVDPKILLSLWIFATLESVSSARQIDRLCQRDLAYIWIRGDVGVNHHMLSDFRSDNGEVFDQLLADTIATLMHQDLVTLETVAQDGMRVRANAGKSSFRRKETLERCREEARQHVQRLREESENEAEQAASDARKQAAQERAARERLERVERALEELNELQQQKEKRKKGSGKEARCSTTDPEARTMKMANGGYNPAYNVQFATDGDSRIIVGVDVTNSGSDRGQAAGMHEKIVKRYGKSPDHYSFDCGFCTKEDVTELERRGSQVIAPVHGDESMRAQGKDPHARQRGDTDEFFTFRQRMATEEAKDRYKQRPSIAEFPNAECRNRGLQQLRVRGLAKAKSVALLHALAFNFMRMLDLGCMT